MTIQPGSRLGPYEIVTSIGAGGMGEVYRARDTRLDRDVAIRIVKRTFTERFEREARAISALNHPHICTLQDVGEHQGVGYLVMEHVEGKPIAGPLPAEQALNYAIQICDAGGFELDESVLSARIQDRSGRRFTTTVHDEGSRRRFMVEIHDEGSRRSFRWRTSLGEPPSVNLRP